MMQPTPWQAGKNPPGRIGTQSRTARAETSRRIEVSHIVTALGPRVASLRGQWGYLLAAIGNLVTFTVLFQPWVNAATLDGRIKATPFGKFEISSSLVNLWAGAPPKPVTVNGTWAVLATVAATFTISAVVVNLWARAEILCRLAAGSSIAMALFVVFALVHMNRKAPELRDMLAYSPKDVGGQIGLLMRWINGNGQYPVPGLHKVSITTASLTSWAWFAAAMAVVSAVAACVQWTRNRPSGPNRIPWRMPVIITRRGASEPTPAAQSSVEPTPAQPTT
ncbi:hypothetical protein [Nocardia brasiliensis]|uniref:hypothetical protein n=1 Tax=Nocardia brasiliensis TaxID=37326 RepID=UPI002457B986|nr:hypothetical protein [Nocardia brasiliensis]